MPIKRVNYYDHEFLHAVDFIAEQDYHRGMRYRHNRLLHTPGVADGLDVTFQSGSTKVTIGSGTAVDDLGQEIVIPDGETRTYELASAKAPTGQTATVYLTIAYADKPDDPTTETDGAGNTRVSEDPVITHLANPPQNPTRRLVLAKVTMSDTALQSVDKTNRLAAGAVAGDLAVSSLRLKAPNVDSSKWVVVAGTAANQASLTGSLSIAKSAAQSTDGNLSVDGRLGLGIASPANRLDVLGQGVFRSSQWLGPAPGTAALVAGFDPANAGGTGMLLAHNNVGASARLWLEGDPIIFAAQGAVKAVLDGSGNLGIGVATPSRPLHVHGNEIHSGGPGAGLSFSDRQGPSFSDDAPGRRWVWYSDGNTARLWTSQNGDLLWIKPDGLVGIGTTDPQAKLHVAGGDIRWGEALLTADQGGSIELGGRSGVAGVGTPYIDFHSKIGTVAVVQDYNVRLINDGVGQLTIASGGAIVGIPLQTTTLRILNAASQPGRAVAGSWDTASDRRLKKNVKRLGGSLDRVRELEGVTFEWKRSAAAAAGGGGGLQIGLLADQVGEHFPELVGQWEGADGKSYSALDYGRMSAVLVEAVKELAERVEALEAAIQAKETGEGAKGEGTARKATGRARARVRKG